jgi:hypothetical protein
MDGFLASKLKTLNLLTYEAIKIAVEFFILDCIGYILGIHIGRFRSIIRLI